MSPLVGSPILRRQRATALWNMVDKLFHSYLNNFKYAQIINVSLEVEL